MHNILTVFDRLGVRVAADAILNRMSPTAAKNAAMGALTACVAGARGEEIPAPVRSKLNGEWREANALYDVLAPVAGQVEGEIRACAGLGAEFGDWGVIIEEPQEPKEAHGADPGAGGPAEGPTPAPGHGSQTAGPVEPNYTMTDAFLRRVLEPYVGKPLRFEVVVINGSANPNDEKWKGKRRRSTAVRLHDRAIFEDDLRNLPHWLAGFHSAAEIGICWNAYYCLRLLPDNASRDEAPQCGGPLLGVHIDIDKGDVETILVAFCAAIGVPRSAIDIVVTGSKPSWRAQAIFFCEELPDQLARMKVVAKEIGADINVYGASQLLRLPGCVAWPMKGGMEQVGRVAEVVLWYPAQAAHDGPANLPPKPGKARPERPAHDQAKGAAWSPDQHAAARSYAEALAGAAGELPEDARFHPRAAMLRRLAVLIDAGLGSPDDIDLIVAGCEAATEHPGRYVALADEIMADPFGAFSATAEDILDRIIGEANAVIDAIRAGAKDAAEIERHRAGAFVRGRNEEAMSEALRAGAAEIKTDPPGGAGAGAEQAQEQAQPNGGPSASGATFEDHIRVCGVISAALEEKAGAVAGKHSASADKARIRVLLLLNVHLALGHIRGEKFDIYKAAFTQELGPLATRAEATDFEMDIGRLAFDLLVAKPGLSFDEADLEARRLARACAHGKPQEHHVSWGPFTMSAAGLEAEVTKGSGANAEIVVVPVSGPFEILGSSRDTKGEGWGRWLRWQDADGREHTQLVTNAAIHGDAKALCAALGENGLKISAGFQDMLKKYLGGLFDVEGRVTVAQRTGWLELADGGRAFVQPHGTIKPDGAEEVVLDARAHASYAQSGTLEDWKAGVGKLAADHDAAVFFVSVGFTGPLLGMAGVDGAAIHGFGDTTIGKTTLAAMNASVWGKGCVSGGFIRTWRATANGLEGAAAGSTDTNLVLDEVGQLESKEAYGTVYMLANGSGKSRANRDGSLRDAATWRVMVVSTGELPFKQKLAEDKTKKSKGGQHVRMLDLPVDRRLGFGAFNSTGRFEKAGQLADACKKAAMTSYGTAGPAFVQALINAGIDGEEVQRRVDAWLAANVTGVAGEVQRVAKTFALIAVAGELAIELGIAPWAKGKAASAALWAANAWMGQRGGAGAMDEMTALAHVRQIVETFGESRFKEVGKLRPVGRDDKGNDVMAEDDGFAPPIMYGYRKGEGAAREWYVLEETWKSVFCEGQNPDIVIKALRAAGALRIDSDGKHVKPHVRLGKDGKQRAYVITAKLLESNE